MKSTLAVRIQTSGADEMGLYAQARVLVDGQDLITTWFPEGFGVDPDLLLGSDGGLRVPEEPHRVMIGAPECDPACCGWLGVRIRRDGEDVVWDEWITPRMDRVPTTPVRFDADAYTAELDRADRDRSWEWTGRTVVRLARRLIAEDSAVLARLGRGAENLLPWPPPEADSIQIPLPAPQELTFDPPRPPKVTVRFNHRDPSAQAADLVVALTEAATRYTHA
jgi:hypothetical protein